MQLSGLKGMQTRRANAGLTVIEVSVIIAAGGIILILWLSALQRGTRRWRDPCIYNLKQIGLATRIFATDHGDKFPSELSTNFGGCAELVTEHDPLAYYFRCLAPYLLSPTQLVCFADSRKPAESWRSLQHGNVSYFIGWSASEMNPLSLLAGDRTIAPRTGWVWALSNHPVVWQPGLHVGRGNVVLGDGSVQQLSGNRLNNFLGESATTNRLRIP
jgi:hypothetical protein